MAKGPQSSWRTPAGRESPRKHDTLSDLWRVQSPHDRSDPWCPAAALWLQHCCKSPQEPPENGEGATE